MRRRGRMRTTRTILRDPREVGRVFIQLKDRKGETQPVPVRGVRREGGK